MKWFKHDSDAGNDSKLKKVKKKYGLAGYGLYFHVLELMSRKLESDIENVGFLSEEWDLESLEIEFGQTPDNIGTMLDYMVSINLFQKIEGKIYNDKLRGRCDEYTAKLIKRLQKGKNSGVKSRQSPDSVPTKSDFVPPRIDIDKNRVRIDKEDKNINIINKKEIDKEKKYSKLSDLTEIDFEEISEKYKVPLAFVKSKFDDLENWHEMRPQKNKYANYRRGLMDWVKRDMLKIMNRPINPRSEELKI